MFSSQITRVSLDLGGIARHVKSKRNLADADVFCAFYLFFNMFSSQITRVSLDLGALPETSQANETLRTLMSSAHFTYFSICSHRESPGRRWFLPAPGGHIYIYTYMYMYILTDMYMYVYIYIQKGT